MVGGGSLKGTRSVVVGPGFLELACARGPLGDLGSVWTLAWCGWAGAFPSKLLGSADATGPGPTMQVMQLALDLNSKSSWPDREPPPW